jgi:Restriction endonuclease BglII
VRGVVERSAILRHVDLTTSYESAIPAAIRDPYDFAEVRNAAAILNATNPEAFEEVVGVLRDFRLEARDITEPGGRKSRAAIRVDEMFRVLGWREAQQDLRIVSRQTLQPYRPAAEKKPKVVETEVLNFGYKVDNAKERFVLDVEWNAKDGNLDRDLSIYRALYDAGVIDGAVIITRVFAGIRDLAVRLGRPGAFNSTTTTTMDKLTPRMYRGSAGGCPVLAVAITERCYRP